MFQATGRGDIFKTMLGRRRANDGRDYGTHAHMRSFSVRFLKETGKLPRDGRGSSSRLRTRQGEYGLPVCCAHEKGGTTERSLAAMILNVPHHCPVAERVGSDPQVVKLSEPLVGKRFNCTVRRLTKL